MKKFISIIAVIIMVFSLFTFNASAACTLNATASKKEVYLGETVTVTLTFKDSVPICGVDASINFDTSRLEYVSAKSTLSSGGEELSGQVLRSLRYDTSSTSNTYTLTLTFKAKAIGSAAISVTTREVTDANGDLLGAPSANITITVKEKNKSSVATLKKLAPPDGCTLSPAFSSSIYEYTCTVPYSVEIFTLYWTVTDPHAYAEGFGSRTLKVGENTRGVKVTAEDGTTKEYTVTITRLPQDAAVQPTEDAPATPTPTSPEGTVIINNTVYNIINIDIRLPEGFVPEDYTFGGSTVPTAVLGNVRVFQLSDGTTDALYMYRNNEFVPFCAITENAREYVILPEKPAISSDFIATSINIDGASYPAWVNSALGEGYYVLNVVNSLGDNYAALYCNADNTIQKLSPALAGSISTIAGVATPSATAGSTNINIDLGDIDWRLILLIVASLVLVVLGVLLIVFAVKAKKTSKAEKKSSRDWQLNDEEDPYNINLEVQPPEEHKDNNGDDFE